MRLTPRVANIAPSATLALDERAKQLVSEGRDVVNMAVGEPDFPAPMACRKAAAERATSGDVRYTAVAGAADLRAAVAKHLGATRGADYAPGEVVICHSAKHALSGALLATAGPGDEVLIPLPAWVSYVEQVRIAGAEPVLVPPRPGCRPDLEALAAAVTPRTRVLMINSPANPTGYVWTRAEIEAAAELAVQHDLWLLSDEIYRRLVYEGPPNVSPSSLAADVRARTILIDGASKCFAMTGYRVGYLAAPKPLAVAVGNLHGQMTGSPNTLSQAAFLAALTEEPPEVEAMVQEFSARRRVLLGHLEELRLETPEPRGAFYAFPDVSRYLDERGSAGFCEDLLEQQRLCLVPGSAFGTDGHVRLSYALSREKIEEAVRRLTAFLATRG